MIFKNTKLFLGFVLVFFIMLFSGFRDASCRGGPPSEPPKISHLVEISTPLKVTVDDESFTFRAEEATEKEHARDTPYKANGTEIKITPIMNLDIYAIDLKTQQRKSVAEMIKKAKELSSIEKMPPIKVRIKLSSAENNLYFWEPKGGGGEWAPAESYKGKDIIHWEKEGQVVKFTIINWPKDDRQSGEG